MTHNKLSLFDITMSLIQKIVLILFLLMISMFTTGQTEEPNSNSISYHYTYQPFVNTSLDFYYNSHELTYAHTWDKVYIQAGVSQLRLSLNGPVSNKIYEDQSTGFTAGLGYELAEISESLVLNTQYSFARYSLKLRSFQQGMGPESRVEALMTNNLDLRIVKYISKHIGISLGAGVSNQGGFIFIIPENNFHISAGANWRF